MSDYIIPDGWNSFDVPMSKGLTYALVLYEDGHVSTFFGLSKQDRKFLREMNKEAVNPNVRPIAWRKRYTITKDKSK